MGKELISVFIILVTIANTKKRLQYVNKIIFTVCRDGQSRLKKEVRPKLTPLLQPTQTARQKRENSIHESWFKQTTLDSSFRERKNKLTVVLKANTMHIYKMMYSLNLTRFVLLTFLF